MSVALKWLLPALLLATACKRDPEPEPVLHDGAASVVRNQARLTSDSEATIWLDVPIEDGMTSFMVTSLSNRNVSVEEIRDPDGDTVLYWEDWYYNDDSLTYAVWEDTLNVLNWPVRAQDGPLWTGTWQVKITTTDDDVNYVSGTEVDVVVHRHLDDSLDSGTVGVRIVWADGIEQDDQIVQATRQAVERWRTIWAARGIALAETYETSALDPAMGFAYEGGSEAKAVAASSDAVGLVLIIGERYPDGVGTFGFSGGLPGTLEPTNLTYVTLSWLAHAGADARFSDEEVRIMGETMAHECGHYMGLFHPVESEYDGWDALDDTPSCRNETACDRDLGHNVMYPYPVCDWETCIEQGDVTTDQSGVLHRYTGTL